MRRLQQLLLTLVLLAAMGLMAGPAFAAGETNLDCQYLEGKNLNYQDYDRWSSPVYSYLTTKGDGYMRVQGNVQGQDGNATFAVYYDRDFKVLSRQKIEPELPIFGGFYETNQNYYLVTGQINRNDSDSVEVFRITKYDKNWGKITSWSLYGEDTYYPFDAGSCRMSMYGKYMIVRTAHEMYKSSDGLHHQSCYTLIVDTEGSVAKGSTYNYASHSFNQLIGVEGNQVYTADHGDAYPRAIRITKGGLTERNGFLSMSEGSSSSAMTFPGKTGENTTGASIGAMQISSNNVLIAGNSVIQDDQNLSRETRNIFVSSTNKSTMETELHWITNYEEGEATTKTPQLVKTGTDQYMLLWGRENKVYYTIVNGSGEKQGDIYSLEGKLSDCVPIVSNGKVIWYTWNGAEEIFYQIPLSNMTSPVVQKSNYDHDYVWQGTDDNGLASLKCSKCGDVITGKVPTSFSLWWQDRDSGSGSYSSYSSMRLGVDGRAAYMTSNLAYSTDSDRTFATILAESDDPENCIVSDRTVTFKKKGTYVVTVYPEYNPELKKTCTFYIVDPVSAVTVSTDESSNLTIGGRVGIKAETEGGIGTLQYTYHIKDPSGEEVLNWTGKSPNTTYTFWQWSPESSGNYEVVVEVVDSKASENTITSEPFTLHIHDYQWVKTEDGIATLRCPECGAETTARVPISITVLWRNAAATGGGYSYNPPRGLEVGDAAEYWIHDVQYAEGSGQKYGDLVISAADPDACTIDEYAKTITFHEAGIHEITFSPKYNPELKQTYTCKVVKALEAVALTADPKNTQKFGGKVTLTAAPNGGKGTLTYQFVCIDAQGQETVIRKADESTTCEWTPAKAGPFTLKVYVTDTGDGNRKVSGSLNYTIAKADHPPVLPAETINTPNSVKELSNDILAETPGWEFAETDLGKELVAGETAEFTATYKGEDAGNYETLTAIVKVFRSTCDHAKWEMRNEKAATCKESGWSGDKYCLLCESLIEAGHEIPVTEDHVAGKSVIENNVDPGCETQGSYDVVIYCDVCGKELTRETVTVPATGHAWNEGVITAYPTADADGVRTFTCGNCGQVRTESIPKDVDEITPSEEMAENAPVDDSIPVVNTSKIKTVSNLKKKQMSVKFPANAAVDNYRIQYRLAGKAAWKNAWSAGTDSYIIKGLKRYSLCEFRIAGFMKQPDGTWVRGNWSKVAYRYANAVALKSAKAGKKSITMTWAKDAKATGYQIQYSLKSNMKGATTITVKGKAKTKYTIKGLKSGKKYYVKVRPIKKSGKTYIGSLSKAKAVKVK